MACFPQRLDKALRGGGFMRVECRKVACGHTADIPARQALRLFGPHATPQEVGRRLRCKVCGGKNVDIRL